jgi:hypothetical protein
VSRNYCAVCRSRVSVCQRVCLLLIRRRKNCVRVPGQGNFNSPAFSRLSIKRQFRGLLLAHVLNDNGHFVTLFIDTARTIDTECVNNGQDTHSIYQKNPPTTSTSHARRKEFARWHRTADNENITHNYIDDKEEVRE